MHRAAHHVGGKARTLFVREETDGQRTPGDDPGIVQARNDLESGQDSEVAVVQPSRGHGVDVGAGHHWRACFPAGTHAHHVADAIHGDGEPKLLHPGDHEVASVPVGIAEGQSADSATGEGTHGSKSFDPTHQAVDVDAEIGARIHFATSSGERPTIWE